MMVHVFVHASAPFLGSQVSEEGMRMPRAIRFPARVKLAQTIFQAFSFQREISRITDHECLLGWIVLRKRLLVGVDRLY